MSSLSPLVAAEAPVGRADEIVQRITEAIHLGLLDDGERLPVEIDLAAQFGVAPMTVRDALATLRAQGLVQTRRGRSGGSFVTRPDGPPIGQLTAKLAAMSASDLRDLFDEHTAIAGQAASAADTTGYTAGALDPAALETGLWQGATAIDGSARRAHADSTIDALLPADANARQIGQILYAALFDSPLRECLETSLRGIDPQRGEGVRIVINTTDAPELARLP